MSICVNCPKCICNKYPQPTKGINTEHKEIMVVGEFPTPIEARQNKVMSGNGAQIIKQTFAKVGLPYSDTEVAFTTAIACSLPKSKKIKIPKATMAAAMTNCRTRLVDEILKVSPAMLFVCGATALQTLTGNLNLKISSEIGRLREYGFLPGIKVMPIINPGMLMHSPGEYKPFLASLQQASDIYQGEALVKPKETTWYVLDTEAKVDNFVANVRKYFASGQLTKMSCDIETTSLDYREAEFLVAGMSYRAGEAFILPRHLRHRFKELMEVPLKWIWQHGKYDKKVAWRRALANINIGADTMYLHYVLDETSEHNLGYLTKIYLKAEEYKYKMNQNWKAVTLESYEKFFEALCERVAVDADYTLQLEKVLADEVAKEPALQKLYSDLLIPAANFLSRVEQNGIMVDKFYLEETNAKYEIILNDIKDLIQFQATPYWDRDVYMEDMKSKSAPVKFNPGSPKQMEWLVFHRMKLKPRIKKGTSTNKEVLKSIERAPDIIKTVLEYRKVQKEKSTYIEGTLEARDVDEKVRTNFTLHITATGRLSSKEPNVQNASSANAVSNVRRAFIAPEGYVLAEIDYSGAELRWLAFLSGCPVLSKVFTDGRNLHNETAKGLFGENYNGAQKLRAKAVNFGIPYGREEQSFVDEFNITLAEAAEMISGWLNMYHGARDYLEWCASQVVQGNFLETPFGRRRRFGLVTPASLHGLKNEARNFPIQSSSSDLLLVCAMAMEDYLKEHFDTQIINLVHDSILLVIPAKQEILSAVADYANSVMVQMPITMFNCPIPFKTDFEVGVDWGNLKLYDYKRHGLLLTDGSDELTDFATWFTANTHTPVYNALKSSIDFKQFKI